MSGRIPRLFWAAVFGVVFISAQVWGQDTAAVRSVRAAHESLLKWLGSEDYGKGWKTHLMSDQLAEQLKRGRKADRKVVKAIVDKYSSDTPGLSLEPFIAVREALQAWQVELMTPTAEELPQAVREAKAEFKLPKEPEVARAKSLMQSSLDALETFVGPSSGWRSVLHMDDLTAQLKAAKPDAD